MEYFNVRHPTPKGIVKHSSIQWLGDRFPGDEEQVMQALKNDFDISLILKTPDDGSYRIAVYSASYRAINKKTDIELKIATDWFHDFNGFIFKIDCEEQNDEKFKIFVQALTDSGNFEQMTIEAYSEKHPEW